jgi:hypothetical protein
MDSAAIIKHIKKQYPYAPYVPFVRDAIKDLSDEQIGDYLSRFFDVYYPKIAKEISEDEVMIGKYVDVVSTILAEVRGQDGDDKSE